MDHDDREILRRLTGDPGPAGCQLSEAGSRRLDRWAEVWNGLELPPERGVPPGFAGTVAARARAERADELSWVGAPGWARGLVGAALALGIGIGVVAGRSGAAEGPGAAVAVEDELPSAWTDEPGLAGLYLELSDEVDGETSP